MNKVELDLLLEYIEETINCAIERTSQGSPVDYMRKELLKEELLKEAERNERKLH